MASLRKSNLMQLAGGAVMLRPRICNLLALLRVHNPDCKHCMARLTCGTELRKRLEELNRPVKQPETLFSKAA